MEHSIKPALEEAERAYAFLNRELFQGELDSKVVITIQTRGLKKALGWHWAAKWQNGKARLAEINLSAEELTQNDPYETLIHEMAHHLNHQRGIRDVSRSQYHNRHFKEAAERAGLVVMTSGNVGYGITALGVRAKEALLKFKPQREVFNILRNQEPAGREPKLRKWSCPCGVNVRVGRQDFKATCNLCSSPFELREGGVR